MNENERRIFFGLIKTAVLGIALTDDLKAQFTYEMLPKFYSLSKKHSIVHLIALGIEANGLCSEENEFCGKFQKQKINELFRQERINYHFEEQCRVLSEAKIPFMPLKGSVIKNFYPEKWMRTSCDIDILVHEKDVKRAETALKKELSYTGEKGEHYHNLSLYSADGVHLELHFSIKEAMKNIDALLVRVWDYSEKTADNEFEFKQSNEFLMFHIIAHMYYHFLSGGCGIKSVVDLMLLNQKMDFDKARLEKMCGDCEIEKFYAAIQKLCDVWFESAEHTELTKFMEEFIFAGGVFGNQTSVAQIKSAQKNGKSGYLLSKIFLPLELMKAIYPVLKKHAWLLPFCHVARWIRLLCGRGIKETKKTISTSKRVSDTEIEKTTKFLKEIGVK